jgi:hypothetical protein
MQVMVWNGKAWIARRVSTRSFWLRIVSADRQPLGWPAAPLMRPAARRRMPYPRPALRPHVARAGEKRPNDSARRDQAPALA